MANGVVEAIWVENSYDFVAPLKNILWDKSHKIAEK